MSLPPLFLFLCLFASFGILNGCGGVKSEGDSPSDSASEELPEGCHLPASHDPGGVQVQMEFGPEAGGERGFYLVIPENYDSSEPHRVIMGFSGRDWTGEPMRGYLNIEDGTPNEIFVYLDPKRRIFEGWGEYRGWLLGEHAGPATGTEDFEFVRAVVAYLTENYCIEPSQIFATGQSWGGDMSHVLACFLGDVFRASVPVAANTPYWFTTDQGERAECVGETAVWTMFGVADDAFPNQPYPGAFGDEVNDFWRAEHGCGSQELDLGLGETGECVEYTDCDTPTRYCLYSAQYGHQIPYEYYSSETMAFFRQFEALR